MIGATYETKPPPLANNIRPVIRASYDTRELRCSLLAKRGPFSFSDKKIFEIIAGISK